MELDVGVYVLASLGTILAIGIYRFLRIQRQRTLDAAWEARHPRSAFEYCGKTLHFYGQSHGNQVEFLDPGGCCYLWYPGNPVVVVGHWRCDESLIYFRYGLNTYNPATGLIGGSWEPCPIGLWAASIVEALPSDIFELKRGLPFVLKPHPAIRSIRDLADSGQQS